MKDMNYDKFRSYFLVFEYRDAKILKEFIHNSSNYKKVMYLSENKNSYNFNTDRFYYNYILYLYNKLLGGEYYERD